MVQILVKKELRESDYTVNAGKVSQKKRRSKMAETTEFLSAAILTAELKAGLSESRLSAFAAQFDGLMVQVFDTSLTERGYSGGTYVI